MEVVRHLAIVEGGEPKEFFSFSFLKNPHKPNHINTSPEMYRFLFGETQYESYSPKEFLLEIEKLFGGKKDETFKNIERVILLKYPESFVYQPNPPDGD